MLLASPAAAHSPKTRAPWAGGARGCGGVFGGLGEGLASPDTGGGVLGQVAGDK